jgi:hypothetical protein
MKKGENRKYVGRTKRGVEHSLNRDFGTIGSEGISEYPSRHFGRSISRKTALRLRHLRRSRKKIT